MSMQYRKDIDDEDIFATEEGDCFDQTTTNCCAFALRAAVALSAVWKLKSAANLVQQYKIRDATGLTKVKKLL